MHSIVSENDFPQNEQYEFEVKTLNHFESLLVAKEYLKLNDEVYDYLKIKPQPYHWYSMMFYSGLAKEGIEDWSGAISIYQQIVDRSINREMEYVALSLYRRAYCFEVLLENEKALASLIDAAKLHTYLPLEVTLAEIPARIASLHARFRQTSLADLYALRAEKGIQKLKALKKNSDADWIGKTLVKMGSLSLSQIDEESFRQNIVTLMRNQRYLIQAIELKHPIWSFEAQNSLLSIYTNLWNFINNYKIPSTTDWALDFVNESKAKSEFLSLYLESLEKLKNYEAPSESSAYFQTLSVYNQIKNIETMAVSLLTEEMLKKPWDLTPSVNRLPSSESPSESSDLETKVNRTIKESKFEFPKDFEASELIRIKPLPKKKMR